MPPAAPMHPVVTSAKRKVVEHVAKQFGELFSKADSLLLDMAEKASGSDKQAVYYDLMRQLRSKKDPLSRRLNTEVIRHIDQALGIAAVTSGAPGGALAGLSLVDNDSLQEDLAVTRATESAQNKAADALYALGQRFDYVISSQQIDENSVPIGPKPLCEAFKETLSELDEETPAPVKLLFFKLYEKFVLGNLNDVYTNINNEFAKAGILPNIKTKIKTDQSKAPPRKAPQAAAAAGAASDAGTPSNEFGGETVEGAAPKPRAQPKPAATTQDVGLAPSMLDTFTQLLEQQNEILDNMAQSSAVSSGGVAALDESTQALLKSLSALQHEKGAVPRPDAEENDTPLSAALLKELSELGNADLASNVNAVDAHTIDIVGMLFEFILDDENIPGSLRAVISKLQLPYLKIGLIDKSFFNNYSHPARRLLNELAQAGLGWREGEEPGEDPLFKKVSEIVEHIVEDFEDDVSLFQTLLDDFFAFQADDHAIAQSQELLIERAKTDIKSVIEERIAGRKLPEAITQLLFGSWKEVLSHVHKAHGANSEMWKETVNTADELIWSLQPKEASERSKLIKALPRLLGALRKGFKELDYDDATIDTVLHSLEPLHMAVLHGKDPCNATQTQTVEEETAELSEEERQAAAEQQEAHTAAEIAVRNLVVGDWVEFSFETGKSARGKLIWYDDFLDDYTFVNRAYKVIADKNAKELVDDFAAKKAKRLENIPLFDRALDAVFQKLKSKS